MATREEDRVANAWRESAPFWEKHRSKLRDMFAPLTTALVEVAAIGAGHRVLDVAGGPGEPTFTIATIVGGGGRVVSTDIAGGMVAATHRAAHLAGVGNVRCTVCSAQSLPFLDASFDRTVSRLGVMFFPEPVGAVREMARVTVPGGRVAFVVWGPPDRNPFFRAAADEMARFVPADPAKPDAIDGWRYAEPDSLARVLRDGGLVDVEERPLPFQIALPIDFDGFWQMRIELSDSLREKTGRLDESTRAQLANAVRHATLPYFPAGTMCFPAEARVVSGSTVPN